MRCRDEVSIHSIAEDFFVVTERVSFAPPALIDFAHTRVVDDTADYAVLMSVKTEQSTLQLHCVATIAVEESQLLLPCVYLAAAEDPIEEGVLLDHEEILHMGTRIILQHASLGLRTVFRSEEHFAEDLSYVVLDYNNRLKQYTIYAKDRGTVLRGIWLME